MINVSEVSREFPHDERGALETKVYEVLKKTGIEFTRVDNDSISTMEECIEVGEALGTDICKTILACTSNKSEYYLIIMHGNKRFVSKNASKAIGSSRLSFADAEDMEKLLGTKPGNASPLSVLNDADGKVELIVDGDLADDEWIACNVGVNTTHIRFKMSDFLDKFLPETNHTARVVNISEEAEA